MPDKLRTDIEKLVELYGEEKVSNALRLASEADVSQRGCTILVNRGVHHFPDYIFRFPDVFVVYDGSGNLEDEREFSEFVENKLSELAFFLKEKKWSKIDIVISGHSSICMQVKMLVYRVTHIDSTDWVYNGKGQYFPLRIPFRALVTSAKSIAV